MRSAISNLWRAVYAPVVLAVFSLLISTSVSSEEELDPLPPWNHQELMKSLDGLPFEPGEITAVKLLAWNSELNSKGQRVDNVLFWIRLHVANPKEYYRTKPDLWILFSESRFPDTDGKWRENARIGNHEAPGIAFFEAPPKNNDIYKFLGLGWSFSSNDKFTLIGGTVRSKTWSQVLGEYPTRFHANEKPASQ